MALIMVSKPQVENQWFGKLCTRCFLRARARTPEYVSARALDSDSKRLELGKKAAIDQTKIKNPKYFILM